MHVKWLSGTQTPQRAVSGIKFRLLRFPDVHPGPDASHWPLVIVQLLKAIPHIFKDQAKSVLRVAGGATVQHSWQTDLQIEHSIESALGARTRANNKLKTQNCEMHVKTWITFSKQLTLFLTSLYLWQVATGWRWQWVPARASTACDMAPWRWRLANACR